MNVSAIIEKLLKVHEFIFKIKAKMLQFHGSISLSLLTSIRKEYKEFLKKRTLHKLKFQRILTVRKKYQKTFSNALKLLNFRTDELLQKTYLRQSSLQ